MQWIFTKDIVFKKESIEPVMEDTMQKLCNSLYIRPSSQLTAVFCEVLNEMVDFLLLTDQLLMQPNPAMAITLRMRKLLRQHFWDRESLAESLIEPVFMLPSGYPARKLISQIGALAYLKEEVDDNYEGKGKRCKSVFEKDMETVPGFAKATLDEGI